MWEVCRSINHDVFSEYQQKILAERLFHGDRNRLHNHPSQNNSFPIFYIDFFFLQSNEMVAAGEKKFCRVTAPPGWHIHICDGQKASSVLQHSINNVEDAGDRQIDKAGHISATTQQLVHLKEQEEHCQSPPKWTAASQSCVHKSPETDFMRVRRSQQFTIKAFPRVRFTQSTCDGFGSTCRTYPNPGPREDPLDHLSSQQETVQTLQRVPTGTWQPKTPLSHIMSYQPVVSSFPLWDGVWVWSSVDLLYKLRFLSISPCLRTWTSHLNYSFFCLCFFLQFFQHKIPHLNNIF